VPVQKPAVGHSADIGDSFQGTARVQESPGSGTPWEETIFRGGLGVHIKSRWRRAKEGRSRLVPGWGPSHLEEVKSRGVVEEMPVEGGGQQRGAESA